MKYKLENENLLFILYGFTKEAGLKCAWFRLTVGNLQALKFELALELELEILYLS